MLNNAYTLLVDSPTKTVLVRNIPPQLTAYIQKNVLDSQSQSIPPGRLAKNKSMLDSQKWITWDGRSGVATVVDEPDPIVVAKAEHSHLLMDGYKYLSYVSSTLSQNYHGMGTLDLWDLMAYPQAKTEYAQAFSASTGVPIAQAVKQLDFDYAALKLSMVRRKEVWWKFEKISVEDVSNTEKLETWKNDVLTDIFGVGLV